MIEPAGHRVLIKPDPIKKVSDGGILIVADEKLEKAAQMSGMLVAVGRDAWKAFGANFDGRRWAEPGDYVMYARYAGKVITDPYTGEDYLIMNDDDVVAVLHEGNNEEYSHPRGLEAQKHINVDDANYKAGSL